MFKTLYKTSRCTKKISYELSYIRTTLSCTRTVVPVVRDAYKFCVVRSESVLCIMLYTSKFSE